MFSIDKVIANHNKSKFQNLSHFDILITPPSSLIGDSKPDDLIYRCISGPLPGRNIMTRDFAFQGPLQTFAYNASYENVTIGILCSEDMNEKLFLEKWADIAIGNHREKDDPSDDHAWGLGFPDEYRNGTVTMRLYNSLGKRVLSCKLVRAFPVTVGPIEMDWSRDELAIFNCSFSYHYYTYQKETS